LKQAADEYELPLRPSASLRDWEGIRAEVEPLFKEAAIDFRNRKRSSVCPRKDESEASLQETFPFLDEIEETDEVSRRRKNRLGGSMPV